ncbi:hypothetical protein SAMN05660772_02071 [Pasteurella testudinis DSM 23072]|uniref:Uncharacterized protein n=1 Tax=Pasteurella testudinis DSM 23072 TaxID=1122938 RepID=A0A1W1UNH2_9PAST|nr:hypothetical protein [Pasteurella testudinis]SMB82351.1 hypothetical protein SAMN05660772_02071 [Pasteurella testudinis DSM 23072]SUB52243.1 Uncharacterised protein [Pasteurella testudinis]
MKSDYMWHLECGEVFTRRYQQLFSKFVAMKKAKKEQEAAFIFGELVHAVEEVKRHTDLAVQLRG